MQTETEIWRERRQPRSLFGRLVKWTFVGFNLWIAAEILFVLSRIGDARRSLQGSGLGQAIVGVAGQNVLFEWFAIWTVGLILLGGATLATRGKKEMVRMVERTPQ